MPLVPVLAWLAIVRDGDVFVAVLIACLIGDVVDGRRARALNATSSLGAQLDSIADTLLFLAAAGGIAVFHAEVISKHAVVFTLVPSAWIGENLVALWRSGRLSSFHTYLSRAAAVTSGRRVRHPQAPDAARRRPTRRRRGVREARAIRPEIGPARECPSSVSAGSAATM